MKLSEKTLPLSYELAEKIGIHFDHSKEYRSGWQFSTVLHCFTLVSVGVTLISYIFIGHRGLMFIVANFTAGLIESGSILQISISFTILLRALYTRFAALNEIFRYVQFCFNSTL